MTPSTSPKPPFPSLSLSLLPQLKGVTSGKYPLAFWRPRERGTETPTGAALAAERVLFCPQLAFRWRGLKYNGKGQL